MMEDKANIRTGGSGGEAGSGSLGFIDHDRQSHAEKVRLPHAGEVVIGDYLEGGGVGPLGEFHIDLHELGDRDGRLDPRLCVFGDGAAALAVLLGIVGPDLSTLLAPVADHAELSRRLVGLGLRDRSDWPLEEVPDAR